MRLVRTGVFETNSSSTHTCIICKEDSFDKWCNGEYVYWEGAKSELNKIFPNWKNYLIDGKFFEYSLFKDMIFPGASKATFDDFFRYVMEEFLDVEIEDDLEQATKGWATDALCEIGLYTYDCFVYYYENCTDGGEIDRTDDVINIDGKEVPIVAYCAMTAN